MDIMQLLNSLATAPPPAGGVGGLPQVPLGTSNLPMINPPPPVPVPAPTAGLAAVDNVKNNMGVPNWMDIWHGLVGNLGSPLTPQQQGMAQILQGSGGGGGGTLIGHGSTLQRGGPLGDRQLVSNMPNNLFQGYQSQNRDRLGMAMQGLR